MTTELAHDLEQILSGLAIEPLCQGLTPANERIAALFLGSSEPANSAQLVEFCSNYIRFVPTQAASLNGIAKTLQLRDAIEPYVGLAIKYLEAACHEIKHSQPKESLEAFLILLQGAYIFGRMQEELDDKVQAFIGAPVSHVNLMESNLIVHEIIGDNFANRLDKVVASLVQQSKISKSIIEANLDKSRIDAAKQANQSLMGHDIESFAARFGYGMTEGLL